MPTLERRIMAGMASESLGTKIRGMEPIMEKPKPRKKDRFRPRRRYRE